MIEAIETILEKYTEIFVEDDGDAAGAEETAPAPES